MTRLLIARFKSSNNLQKGTSRNDAFFYLLKKNLILLLLSLLALGCHNAPANSFKLSEKLSLPRFVSIKFNEVNARTGPSIKHPIEWVFVLKGEPVEVVAEYEQWRQIRDIEGEGGWVHLSALSGKRSIIITGKDTVTLHKSPETDKVIAYLGKNVRCGLNKCKAGWCRITCQKYTGWVEKKYCWGVYDKEG